MAPVSAFAVHIAGNWDGAKMEPITDDMTPEQIQAVHDRYWNHPTHALIHYLTHRSYDLWAKLDECERVGLEG